MTKPNDGTPWAKERLKAANFKHDLEVAQDYWKVPVCPDCLLPCELCSHREAWEFLGRQCIDGKPF